MKTKIHILALSLLSLLSVSCERNFSVSVSHAISFNGDVMHNTVTTKSDVQLSEIASQFIVWGYEGSTGNTSQVVFPGYRVRYSQNSEHTTLTNTNGWEYVGQEEPEETAQSIKYWNLGVEQARFYAYVPNSNTAFDRVNGKLQMEGLSLTTEAPATPLFSKLWLGNPVSSCQSPVRLEFMRPYSKITVKVYSTKAPVVDVHLTDISFGPVNSSGQPIADGIRTQGKVSVTYGMTSVDWTTESTGAGQGTFGYEDCLLTGTNWEEGFELTPSDRPSGSTSLSYYAIPDESGNIFSMKLSVDGNLKSASVPAEYMKWEPNYSYLYIFKLNDVGSLLFYDAVVEDWTFGGESNNTWTSW